VLITVLHLLHGWSDRDETTGHLRRRSTGRHHSAINRTSSAPFNIVREQHLPSSTRYLLRPHLRIYYYIYNHLHPPFTPLYSTHSPVGLLGSLTLSVYLEYTVEDYSLWITLHLHRHGLTLPDYRCVRGRLTIIIYNMPLALVVL